KIVPRSLHRHSVNHGGGPSTGECKRAARILSRVRVRLLQAKVSSPTHIVPAAIPDHPIGDLHCLVTPQRRSDVIQAAEIRERQVRDTPIERIARNACNPEKTSDVLLKCVEVRGSGTVAVVVQIQLIDQTSDWTHIAGGGVDPRCVVRPADRWKWVVQYAAPCTKLQTKIVVASTTAAPPATSTASAESPEAATPTPATALSLLL